MEKKSNIIKPHRAWERRERRKREKMNGDTKCIYQQRSKIEIMNDDK